MAKPRRGMPTTSDSESSQYRDDDHHITVHLDEILELRQMTLTELGCRIGIALPNLSILKTGKARAIRFSTLDAICTVLDCQPGDILHRTPTAAKTDVT